MQQRTTPRGLPTPIDLFVEAAAVDLDLDQRATSRRTRRVLRRLAEWATSEGMPLEREDVFDPDTIERFSDAVLVGEASAATYRSVLRRVAPKLTRRAPWEPRPTAIARRQLALPYEDEEIACLLDDARLQPTQARRRAAHALLALGLGAGLDGRWACKVRPPDVERVDSVVVVRVPEPAARSVVLLARWEDLVLELVESPRGEFLVGGNSTSSNRPAHLTERLVVPFGHPRLVPARLRSTWLRAHLEAGTRLTELCQAAGMSGVGVLSDLFSYVRPLPEDAARAMLRGSHGDSAS